MPSNPRRQRRDRRHRPSVGEITQYVNTPPGEPITIRDADALLRAYHELIPSWSVDFIMRNFGEGSLRDRLLVDVPSAVLGDVSIEFKENVKMGNVRNDNLRGFLFVKTESATCKHISRQVKNDQREPPTPDDTLARHGGEGDPEELAIQAEEARWLETALKQLPRLIARLPQLQQRVVNARLRGLSFAEIGVELEKSEGAVRVMFCRALEKLRVFAITEKNNRRIALSRSAAHGL